MKISNFLKTHFLVLYSNLLIILHWISSDNKKEIWSFGLCWSLLALDEFFKQKLSFADKN